MGRSLWVDVYLKILIGFLIALFISSHAYAGKTIYAVMTVRASSDAKSPMIIDNNSLYSTLEECEKHLIADYKGDYFEEGEALLLKDEIRERLFLSLNPNTEGGKHNRQCVSIILNYSVLNLQDKEE
jgi:hypothetical protein